METRNVKLLVSAGVVALFSAVGHSFSRVANVPDRHGALLALAGAGAACVALTVGWIVGPAVRTIEDRGAPRSFLGLKVFTVGFLITTIGWLVGVYIHGVAGYSVCLAGLVISVTGIGMHFFLTFRARIWL